MKKLLLILIGFSLMGAGQAHQKRSTLTNDGDTTRVQVSDWNALHLQSPTSSAYFWDEFVGGANNSSQNIGKGWSFTAATGGIALIASVAGHPGIDSMGTGSTTNNYIHLRLASDVNKAPLMLPEDFEAVFYIKPGQDSSINTVTYRIGFVDSSLVPTLNEASNAIYFERISTDSIWYGVTISGASKTRTSTGVGCRNLWTEFKIRYVDSATDSVGFSVDGTEVMATANLPATVMMPYVLVWNNSAVNHQIFIDAFGWSITGLTR